MKNSNCLAFAFVCVSVAAVFGACEGAPTVECSNNEQCGAGQVCSVSGDCVECNVTGDCDAGEFCCQGACLGGDAINDHCGCGTSPAGSAGSACGSSLDTAVCLVGDAVADTSNVSSGVCGCGCTAADGGPICGPAGDDGAPTCTCEQNTDCRGAAKDAGNRPHRVSDTCTPQGSCVCFSLGTADVCDPDSVAPDCASAGGCAAFNTAVDNCGSAGRVCNVAATGIDGTGTCKDGGCTCDAATDCNNGVNVNACAFVAGEEGARCVCDGYTKGGVEAACPMELACIVGGCNLNGSPIATEEALLGALGLQ